MTDLLELYRRSIEEFGSRVRAVRDDQWSLPTPDTEWDVRALVNHLVYEELWAPPLLGGRTLEDVGDRFDGDLLGDRPKVAWERAAQAASDAATSDTLDRMVHVSWGQIPGREYISQLTADHTVHAWDLARATGGDERLDPELVEFSHQLYAPQIDGWRTAGIFGPAVQPGPGASIQERLLALTGRTV